MPTYFTLGRTVTTGNTNSQQNTGSNNQYGTKLTMTEVGQIQRLNVYVSGNASSYTGKLVLWNSSGAVIASVDVTFPTGSSAVNGQGWLQVTLPTPYNAASGEVLYLGFWRPSASTANFSYINSGGTFSPAVGSGQSNVGSPGTLAIASTTTGQLCAYLEYVKGGLKVTLDGSTWGQYKVKTSDGTSWTWRPVRFSNGTTWTRIA